MSDRIQKLEGKIAKREQRIEKLNDNLKEERSRLATDKDLLFNLKYSEVFKRLQETGVSPDEALKALENEVEKSQVETEVKEDNLDTSTMREGAQIYAKTY
ncbi:hypothetical protein BK703_33250 [Bacillus thuringiensis serovar silo]|uniref:DUF4315 family protein n=1 Tax=Bacillus cereus TaxID=1396 RepID=A0A9X6B953_BACCE|nr:MULTISPECIES: hypothetical protein [Bacillus cereus group]MED3467763.1 hypothetical protein [Bacillus thuringiensis]OTW46873.1 hypothetical protein BK703_33250 [Bacillus thuringiensis serovar silo]TEA80779.1 hypothetical protein PBMB05447_25625 [Bacillus thuringiensis F14-1]MCQ6287858.1 hypothetical protein [Bacillus cereus]MCQ6384909.1 hypothetical protein [Bacillus cereus]